MGNEQSQVPEANEKGGKKLRFRVKSGLLK